MIVEVNASQAVVIEQIRASLASITFPLQLDNSTEVTAANITTGEPVKLMFRSHLCHSYIFIFLNVVSTMFYAYISVPIKCDRLPVHM